MVYVPNYVDLSLFNNKQQIKESGSINIIYPRRCCEERGFYVMAEIIPKILNKYSNVTFNLVGYPHTKDIEKIINDLIAQYPNNVKHQVADAEKWRNYINKQILQLFRRYIAREPLYLVLKQWPVEIQ